MLARLASLVFSSVLFAPGLHAQLGPAPEPAGNPITPSNALLGKALFFEEQLSSRRRVACAICHDPLLGGADPRFSAAAPSVHPGPDEVFGTGDDAIGSASLPATLLDRRYEFHESFGLVPQVTTRQTSSVLAAAYAPNIFWDGRPGDSHRSLSMDAARDEARERARPAE
ncbi:MAG: cytochrome c peroxidase, partial [Planctomycetota bacterium]